MRKPRVVVFCGGRGARTIVDGLLHFGAEVTLVVNCYDDGLSTGRLRKAIPGMLGPSDIRKNAAYFSGHTWLERRGSDNINPWGPVPVWASTIAENEAAELKFYLVDCPIGNLLFSNHYRKCGNNFNAAVEQFSLVHSMRVGLYNVSDGDNLWLKLRSYPWNGSEHNEEVILSEGELGDRDDINDFWLENDSGEKVEAELNPALIPVFYRADIIIYGPGTFYSSLLPSFATRGIEDLIKASGAKTIWCSNLAANRASRVAYLALASRVPPIDYVLANEAARLPDTKTICANWADGKTHDGKMTARAILDICGF